MPLLPIASQIGSSLVNRFFSVRDQKRQRQWRQQEAEQAYNRDVDFWNKKNVYNKKMWDLQNVYNSPREQMQRFKDAGLNPHLIYGRGNPGQAQQLTGAESAKYQAPRTDFNPSVMDMTGVLGAYQDFRMKNAQIDLVNEQKNIATAEKHEKFLKLLGSQYNISMDKLPWLKADKKYLNAMSSPLFQYYQQNLRDVEQRNQLRELELKWWEGLQGIKGATGIMQIIKMLRK